MGGITCDQHGIYVFGSTTSDDSIATTGCFQPARGGSSDAFLLKLEPELGYKIWGTYFGSTGSENVDHTQIVADDSNNVYITGMTTSISGMATADAWQTVYGGGDGDAFLAKFNQDGQRVWSSYYGGANYDISRACAFDGKGVYICGETASPDHIATPGSFLPAGGGSDSYGQGFVAKIVYPDTSSSPVDTSSSVTPIDNASGGGFSIFPNPNNGSFNVNGFLPLKEGRVLLTVYDITGRQMLRDEAAIVNGRISKQMATGNRTPAGIYFLSITSGAESYRLRFVKE
jgi:hypothetical protein